jgi:hypothetical protein
VGQSKLHFIGGVERHENNVMDKELGRNTLATEDLDLSYRAQLKLNILKMWLPC